MLAVFILTNILSIDVWDRLVLSKQNEKRPVVTISNILGGKSTSDEQFCQVLKKEKSLLPTPLKSKEGTAVTLEIFDPAETIVGVVEKISYPIQSNPNLGSVTQYAILTVRGTRQTTFSAVTSGDVLAVNAYGRMRFG